KDRPLPSCAVVAADCGVTVQPVGAARVTAASVIGVWPPFVMVVVTVPASPGRAITGPPGYAASAVTAREVRRREGGPVGALRRAIHHRGVRRDACRDPARGLGRPLRPQVL